LPGGWKRDGKEAFVYTCKKGFGGHEPDHLYQVELDYVTESDYYKGDPNALIISHVWTDYLSPEELVQERDQLETHIRGGLGIPYHRRAGPVDAGDISYGHSMGQTPILPGRMFRAS